MDGRRGFRFFTGQLPFLFSAEFHSMPQAVKPRSVTAGVVCGPSGGPPGEMGAGPAPMGPRESACNARQRNGGLNQGGQPVVQYWSSRSVFRTGPVLLALGGLRRAPTRPGAPALAAGFGEAGR